MAQDGLAALIQLYSTGLISRTDLERGAERFDAAAENQPASRPEETFIDLRQDASGVWS